MPIPKRLKPPDSLWKGPEEDGVTQSLLGRFLACRERFRLYVVEGLREPEAFNEKIEYGNIWHACEEALAARRSWQLALKSYAVKLQLKYPNDRKAVVKWSTICRIQFPIYVEYWRNQSDVLNRTPVAQELAFRVPYELPSGRIVTLRGKFDGIDLIGRKKKLLYIQENKSKGSINEEQLRSELHYNLQALFYFLALKRMQADGYQSGYKLAGIRYNVVRRPLADWQGKFNIKRRKGRMTKKGRVGEETEAEYYNRLGNLIRKHGEHFFMRWKIEILPSDLHKFVENTFHPILEQLCDWWEWVQRGMPPGDHVHFRMPFGVYNPVMEGRPGAFADFLNKGDTRSVQKVHTLFPELEAA